jgi:hypothetical protein
MPLVQLLALLSRFLKKSHFPDGSLKELHQKCPKEMDAYAGCMYYYTNEFDFCRKEQEAFEGACPISE